MMSHRVGMVVPGGDLQLRRVDVVEGVRKVEDGHAVVIGQRPCNRATGSARTVGRCPPFRPGG